MLREYINTHTLRCGPRDKRGIKEMREAWNTVVEELFAVGEARHWAAHGNGLLTIVARHENETIEFLRVTHKRRGVDKRKYSLTQLGTLTRRANALSSMLLFFDHVMFEAVPEDAANKLFPKLSRKDVASFPVSKRQRHRVR